MERYEAEQLLKLYDEALATKLRDWGDHPYQTGRIDLALARIRELVIRELTAHKLPSEPLGEPIYPNGLYNE